MRARGLKRGKHHRTACSHIWAGFRSLRSTPTVNAALAASGVLLLAVPLAVSANAADKTAADTVPAKQLFGKVKASADLKPRAIGFYSKGCLAGAKALPVDGPAWQAMRLSRNRNWGHPDLVKMVERLATESRDKDGWPGLLVGDLSQPRGGPMLTGHRSHQIGLDADIWFSPMPDRRLTRSEREKLSATSMLASKTAVDDKVFKPGHVRLLKRAAEYKEVERILVHPAIKKALCDKATGDRTWLAKVRPYWGHHYHFHVRIGCPPGSANCRPQAATTGDDGCGKEIDYWFDLFTKPPPKPKPGEKKKKSKPRPPLTLAGLPGECRAVLEAGATNEIGAPLQALVPEPKPAVRRAAQ